MIKKVFLGFLAVVAVALALTAPPPAGAQSGYCNRVQWPPDCNTGPIVMESCNYEICTMCSSGRCCLRQYIWCGQEPNRTLQPSIICSSYCGGQGDWE